MRCRIGKELTKTQAEKNYWKIVVLGEFPKI